MMSDPMQMTTLNSDPHQIADSWVLLLKWVLRKKRWIEEGIVSCGCGEILESRLLMTEGWAMLVQEKDLRLFGWQIQVLILPKLWPLIPVGPSLTRGWTLASLWVRERSMMYFLWVSTGEHEPRGWHTLSQKYFTSPVFRGVWPLPT